MYINLLIILLAGTAFLWRRQLHLLSFFQQEEYDVRRFWQWCRSRRAFDRRGARIALPAALITLLVAPWPRTAMVLSALAAVAIGMAARSEMDPRFAAKKKLVVTQRAGRILRTSFGLSVAVLIALLFLAPAISRDDALSLSWLAVAVTIQLAPAFLMLATRLLAPGERKIQAAFFADAKRTLASVHPYIIGITGSYGKTSTKHVLAAFLSADGPTFRTAKSINTVMGVTREIREKLKPFHKYAVMEMGAYGPGSIRRLAEFTPPNAGIITAVGVMHLERFGSPERIYEAKSELAQAVPADGILVCNGDNPGARRIATAYPKATTLLYGFEGDDLDCRMSDVVLTPEGTRFVLEWKGAAYHGITRLFGRPMLSNLMAAFTMAAALGIHPEVLLALARELAPAENRLQVVSGGSVTWIHDAYNSNPSGFSAAIEVLGQLPGTRRILITPGMVELGSTQYDENLQAAKSAARVADLMFFVGQTNRDALFAGAQAGGATDAAIRWFARRDDAFAALAEDQRPGDVILIENDLPDLYEGRVVL